MGIPPLSCLFLTIKGYWARSITKNQFCCLLTVTLSNSSDLEPQFLHVVNKILVKGAQSLRFTLPFTILFLLGMNSLLGATVNTSEQIRASALVKLTF